MDTGDGYLAVAGSRDALDVRQHVAHATAAARAPGRWDDAVRTRLVAACLNAQGECSTAGQTGSDRRAARAVTIAKPFGRGQADGRRQIVLAIVRHDLDRAGKSRDIVGTPSGIAPRHDNAGVRIFPRDFPHDLTCRLIGGTRDRAGIDDDDVGVLGGGDSSAARDELLLDVKGIGLIDPAAKGDDGVLHLRAEGLGLRA